MPLSWLFDRFLFLVFWKNLNSSKSNIFVHMGVIYAIFDGILDNLNIFNVWVQARGALWDLKYFFSRNNLRIVKQMTASSRIISAVICGKFLFQKSWPSCINTLNLWDRVSCYGVFDFQCCGPDSRCSAGSQIFFPDQQSENCQKSVALETCDALWKIQLLKNHTISHHYDLFVWHNAIILSFSAFSVFVLARGALQDLKYFSLTNNSRFVKKILASSNFWCAVENPIFSKSCIFLQNTTYLCQLLWLF